MWFRLWLLCLLAESTSHLGLAQHASDFISLSCGSPRDTEFDEGGIVYTSDAMIMETGVGRSIKLSHTQQQKRYLRTFPQGIRNCYTFNLTRGQRFLIRSTFLHGGYDDQPFTQFQLHLGPNLWKNVTTTSETDEKVHEMIHLMTKDRLQICLVKTGDSVPFISMLELRRLDRKAYVTKRGSLQTIIRYDIGSIRDQSLRYNENVHGSDVYDRIWWPYNSKNWTKIHTNSSIDNDNEYQPPENALATASVPTDPSTPMNISIDGLHQTSRLFVVLHFVEIEELDSSERREIKTFYNGRFTDGPSQPRRLVIGTIFYDNEVRPNVNGQSTYSVQKTKKSTLPPLLNAIEFYLINFMPQKETDAKEVYAMMSIKARYALNSIDWEGDPCMPREYMWTGINCTYRYNNPPHIISLNLSGRGLTGQILDSLSNLTHLQMLDLSRNEFTGSVPKFLSRMENLKHINLSWNELLNGSIPESLIEKVHKGSVSLIIEGNPMLCASTSCAKTNNNDKMITILASVIGSLLAILVVTVVTLFILKKMRRAKLGRCPSSDNAIPQQISRPINLFTYEELATATDNFSLATRIGEGGFGHVHKGVFPDGTEVAIKDLKPESSQGEREFRAEVETMSRVHHRNILALLGYCSEGSHRFLVYEFVPNKTLEFHLHETGGLVLDWPKRVKIALTVARGLSYLHEDCRPTIIHRDVKAANVLVDHSYEAKIADFGLAKAYLNNGNNQTHVSTRIMGTFGYMCPDYASSGRLNTQSDVYSFGVILLELITGHRPIIKSHLGDDDANIVDWALPLIATQELTHETLDAFVDKNLGQTYDFEELKNLVVCAAACVSYQANSRPKMHQIVRTLEGPDDMME